MPSILIVDDDQSIREILSSILKEEHLVFQAQNLSEARDILKKKNIDLILLDIRIGSENGLTFLQEIKDSNEPVETIIITAIKDVKTAVQAIKQGAFDYINKNFDEDELKAMIEKALDKIRSCREIQSLREEITNFRHNDLIFGLTREMMKVKEIADRAAPLPTTVLITGETGTGKELMARYIHRMSALAAKPFVTVNVGAIPSELVESTLFGHEKGAFTGAHKLHLGKFELASGGTLFLDEIGELKLDLQAKLLRVLQESEVERVGGGKTIPIKVRLITATNEKLKERVSKKEFRDDLYYRLNVVPIELPPLRERREDIPRLIRLFLDRYNRKFNRNIFGFSEEAEKNLLAYHWPGNIRELENVIERVVAVSGKDLIGISDIPMECQLYKVEKTEVAEGEEFFQKALDTFEKSLLLKYLEETDWNQTLTAKRLGIHRKTLEYKIKRLGISEVIGMEKRKS